MSEEKHVELFDWWLKKEETFKLSDIEELLENVKKFNCGAIDDYLSKHVDTTLVEWLEIKREL